MITKGNKWVKCGLQRVKLPNDYVKVEKKRKDLLKRFFCFFSNVYFTDQSIMRSKEPMKLNF